jgi:hypothetical protein
MAATRTRGLVAQARMNCTTTFAVGDYADAMSWGVRVCGLKQSDEASESVLMFQWDHSDPK